MSVCHDLRKSEYTWEIYGFMFYFSSDFYRSKFAGRVNGFVNEFTRKFMVRNRVFLASVRPALARYFSVVCYKLIEKRGFLVVDMETGFRLNNVDPNSWDI